MSDDTVHSARRTHTAPHRTTLKQKVVHVLLCAATIIGGLYLFSFALGLLWFIAKLFLQLIAAVVGAIVVIAGVLALLYILSKK